MAKITLKLEDEHGVEVRVFPHDPASKIVSLLKKHNYQYIVLPRSTWRSGLVAEAPKCDDYIRMVRMNDCLKELNISL